MRDLPPLYILRHGETEWNVEGRFQGHLDSPLTDVGQRQAAHQGQILRAQVLPSHPDIPVWVSPLGRTRATWHLAAKAAGIGARPSRAEPRLAEVHMGTWQGQLREAILNQDTGAGAQPNLFEMSLNTPGGESYDALKTRLQACLSEISEPTICVTHGITSLVLRGLIRGLSRAEMAGQGHDQGIVYCLRDGREHRLEPARDD